MPFQAAYVIRRGAVAGAVLYTNYRVHSVEMIAAGDPGWLTRGDICNAFHYAFIDLGCWTVLTMINRTNSASRELNRRLGFAELCVIETSRSKAEDVVMYGMTRDKCIWLPRSPVRVAA
jgi:L-amino acid N-acyltransferase YncA